MTKIRQVPIFFLHLNTFLAFSDVQRLVIFSKTCELERDIASNFLRFFATLKVIFFWHFWGINEHFFQKSNHCFYYDSEKNCSKFISWSSLFSMKESNKRAEKTFLSHGQVIDSKDYTTPTTNCGCCSEENTVIYSSS